MKRPEYEQRVRKIDGCSFVPLIFSTADGMGRACTATFKRLGELVSWQGSLVWWNDELCALS